MHDQFYIRKMKNENYLDSIREFSVKNKIKLDEKSIKMIPNQNDKILDELITSQSRNSDVFVENIGALGHSLFYILKRIKKMKDYNITLHIIDMNLSLHLKNDLLFNVLESLYQFEEFRVKHRTAVAKVTREKKNIKLGRKEGQTVKSKYEQHKKRILHLHKQGVPNTKIVKDINLGTAQSLGKYIKQLKLAKKRKQKKEGTYLITEDDMKNISDWQI